MKNGRGQKCVSCSIMGQRFTRGLCPRCYQSAIALVKSGETSWVQLEAMNLAVAPRVFRQSPFRKHYDDALARTKGGDS